MGADALTVFSDIDGCLMEEERYSLGPARAMLHQLRAEGIPVVLCTTKTRSEMSALWELLGARYPTVVEDGGGLLLPSGSPGAGDPGGQPKAGGIFVSLSTPYTVVRRHFLTLRRWTRGAVCGFGDLTAREVANLTQLPLPVARRAKRREFDEPFVILRDPIETERAARRFARQRGLRVVRGGRLYHLHGRTDKGRGARKIRRLIEKASARRRVVALGDAALDAPLLRMADIAVIVPRSGGPDPVLCRRVPWARLAPGPGPAGWVQAIEEILAER